MKRNSQIWAVALVILLISSEWGAKCETEQIPFVAEVGRYDNIDSD
jgi:hypothetical protein